MRKWSLSWLVISMKDPKLQYAWYLNKDDDCVDGVPIGPRHEMFEDLANKLVSSKSCILMPDLHYLTDEEAAAVIRKWCDHNDIEYKEDLNEIEEIRDQYYGYDKSRPIEYGYMCCR